MKKLTFVLLITLLCGIQGVFAQNVRISGTVTDESGLPIVGASVTVVGTHQGVATDIDGKYQIDAPANGTLRFSYLGMLNTNMDISGRTVINVQMMPETEDIETVMVVAYGTTTTAGYTGSASVLGKEQIAKSQVSNVSQLLAGNTAGVQSISSIGQPGSDSDIYIRGVGSLNASSTPLYIVDGAPFDGALSSINPNDIESLNVLKDAAATSLYGSRAANGLVIITTKRGAKNQNAIINLSFKYGVSSRAQSYYDMVNTQQYYELTWEALYNQRLYGNSATPADAAQYATDNLVSRVGINIYGNSRFPNPVGLDGKLVSGAKALWNDNWIDEYEKGAYRAEGQVSVSGGGANSTYYISMGYLDEEGISPGSYFTRYTGRINFNTELRKWMRLNTNLSLTNSKQGVPTYQDSSSANSLFQAMLTANVFPVFVRNTETGELILDENGKKQYDYGNGTNGGVVRPSGASPNYNQAGATRYDKTDYTRNGASIRASLEIDLLPELMYTGSANIDYNSNSYHYYRNPTYGSSSMSSPYGSVSKSNGITTGMTFNNVLKYETSFNEIHNLKIMAGHEYYVTKYDNLSGSRSGFAGLGFDQPVAANTLTGFSGYTTEYRLLSFFGNVDYNINNKYYLSGSLRADASSRFYKENRWGLFWALGGSWRISEEDFLKNSNTISKLTLRASYGEQGNDGIGDYGYMNLYAFRNNHGESGYATYRLENLGIKWETIANLNIALDFGLFRNRLSGSVEFFSRMTRDMLMSIPLPHSTGFTGYWANNGNMRNTGIEAQINGTVIHNSDWKWTLNLNLTHFKNKITSIPQETINTYQWRRKGGSIYDFFLAEWAGVDPADGRPQYWKTDANGDRVKTYNWSEANATESRILAGSSLPDLVGGFGTTLNYKNFDLSMQFAYSIGGKIYDRDKSFILNASQPGRSMSADLLDRWTPENTNTDVPRLQTSAFTWASTSYLSTRWLFDASYMRLKNITVGYTLPKRWTEKVYISNCRIFLQAENLFTLFGAQGLDPEQIISGLSYFRYPNMRTISGGINITF